MKPRTISLEELDQFEIDDATGQLFWRGKAVITEGRLRLTSLQAWVAGITASVMAAESALRIAGFLD